MLKVFLGQGKPLDNATCELKLPVLKLPVLQVFMGHGEPLDNLTCGLKLSLPKLSVVKLGWQELPVLKLPVLQVFMGQGEPLDNLPALLPAIDILTHPQGLQFSLRKVQLLAACHTQVTSACVSGVRHSIQQNFTALLGQMSM